MSFYLSSKKFTFFKQSHELLRKKKFESLLLDLYPSFTSVNHEFASPDQILNAAIRNQHLSSFFFDFHGDHFSGDFEMVARAGSHATLSRMRNHGSRKGSITLQLPHSMRNSNQGYNLPFAGFSALRTIVYKCNLLLKSWR